MDTLYGFTKSLIDPVTLIVVLLAAGTLTALSSKKKGGLPCFLCRPWSFSTA